MTTGRQIKKKRSNSSKSSRSGAKRTNARSDARRYLGNQTLKRTRGQTVQISQLHLQAVQRHDAAASEHGGDLSALMEHPLEDLFSWYSTEGVTGSAIKTAIRRKLDWKVAHGYSDHLHSFLNNDPNVNHANGYWLREAIRYRLGRAEAAEGVGRSAGEQFGGEAGSVPQEEGINESDWTEILDGIGMVTTIADLGGIGIPAGAGALGALGTALTTFGGIAVTMGSYFLSIAEAHEQNIAMSRITGIRKGLLGINELGQEPYDRERVEDDQVEEEATKGPLGPVVAQLRRNVIIHSPELPDEDVDAHIDRGLSQVVTRMNSELGRLKAVERQAPTSPIVNETLAEARAAMMRAFANEAAEEISSKLREYMRETI